MYPRCNLTVLHVQTLRSLRYYYQGLVDKMEKESGQSTRCKRTHIHTREGGGIDSQKVEDLMRNWTLQSPLNLGTMEAKKILGWGVEDITAKELEAEFNRLRLRTSDSQGATRYLGPRQHPTRLPDILGGEIHRLVVSREKIDRFFFHLPVCHQLPTPGRTRRKLPFAWQLSQRATAPNTTNRRV